MHPVMVELMRYPGGLTGDAGCAIGIVARQSDDTDLLRDVWGYLLQNTPDTHPLVNHPDENKLVRWYVIANDLVVNPATPADVFNTLPFYGCVAVLKQQDRLDDPIKALDRLFYAMLIEGVGDPLELARAEMTDAMVRRVGHLVYELRPPHCEDFLVAFFETQPLLDEVVRLIDQAGLITQPVLDVILADRLNCPGFLVRQACGLELPDHDSPVTNAFRTQELKKVYAETLIHFRARDWYPATMAEFVMTDYGFFKEAITDADFIKEPFVADALKTFLDGTTTMNDSVGLARAAATVRRVLWQNPHLRDEQVTELLQTYLAHGDDPMSSLGTANRMQVLRGPSLQAHHFTMIPDTWSTVVDDGPEREHACLLLRDSNMPIAMLLEWLKRHKIAKAPSKKRDKAEHYEALEQMYEYTLDKATAHRGTPELLEWLYAALAKGKAGKDAALRILRDPRLPVKLLKRVTYSSKDRWFSQTARENLMDRGLI